MRRLATLLLLFAAPLCGAVEGKFALKVADQEVGTAVLSLTKLAGGGTLFTVDLKIEMRGYAMHQRQEDRYDKDSKPVRSHTLTEQGGKKTERRVVYGKTSLTDALIDNGKKTAKTVRYPAGKSIAKPSQMWFFISTPMPGAVSRETEYDADSSKWVTHERRYVRPTEIEYGGKKIKAYELHDLDKAKGETVKQWVDGQGLPFRIEFGNPSQPMTLERIS